MRNESDKKTEEQSILNGYPQPVGTEKSTAIVNILNGYEDFTLDINGKIISSNLEAVNITGYEEWEAIGRHFSLFYTQEDKQAGQPNQDLENARGCNKLIFSAWRVKKRQVNFWAQITLVCLRDDDGTVTGYKMILKDQTHRLISNNRVKKFRNEYLNLFNNPFIGVFKYKIGSFKIMLINDKGGKIIGMGKGSKKFSEIFQQESDLNYFLETLEKTGKVTGFEFLINRKGPEAWAKLDCSIFPDEGFVEGVITDITQSKLQLLELKRLNEELDNFIYHASHDLRSPLTSLLGLINLMEIDKQIDIADYCTMMRDRVTYLDELLREMTCIVFNSKAEVTVEYIDFSAIVTALIKETQEKYPGIHISLELQGNTLFSSDKSRVLIIFKNLIVNAARHCNSYLKNSFIHISVEIFDDMAIINFKDNGKGIKDDQLLQVFGMFYKISTEVKETGLGLYIVKLMIDKLQGEIQVKSKIGAGTEFQIKLPNLSRLDILKVHHKEAGVPADSVSS